jgi:hypothetical protein
MIFSRQCSDSDEPGDNGESPVVLLVHQQVDGVHRVTNEDEVLQGD